jgi:hypothetical protein
MGYEMVTDFKRKNYGHRWIGQWAGYSLVLG